MSDPFQRSNPPCQPCAVCGDPVSLANVQRQKGKSMVVCRNIDCQRLASLQNSLPPALFKAQFDFQRQRIRTRKDKEAERKRHIDAIEQAEADENTLLLEQFLKTHPDLGETELQIVTLPSGSTGNEPLEDVRIQAYRRHLQKVIEQGFACTSELDLPSDHHMDSAHQRRDVDALFAAHPALQNVSDRFCLQCKGGCCPAGADHAFVSAVTILRLRQAEPDLTEDVILQRYLQAVPAESVPGSCINQTATGCAVPREWRSDVCNGYYCDSVRRVQRQWVEGEAPANVLVIQRSHTNWNRFDGEGVFPVVGIELVNVR